MLRRLRKHLDRRRLQERGVAALVLAIFVTAIMVPLGALGVDIGMQRVGRSDAQAAADSIAMDLARKLGTDVSSATSTVADGAADANVPSAGGAYTTLSHEEQGLVGADVGVRVWQGYVDPDASPSHFVSNQGRGCGSSSPYDGYFQSIPATETPNAVLVSVSSKIGFHFYPGSSGGVCRSAVAVATPTQSCYKVSSFALGLDTSDSVLGPLLGINNASVQVLSSSGIANAQVSLLGLATQLGVGTPDALVSDPNVTIGQFVAASATVLSNSGDTADAELLQSLAVDLGSLTGKKMNLGSLLSLGQGNNSSLDADVGVGDLLTGALMIANSANAVKVPGLNLSVPGVGTFTATATIVQPPVIGCNGGSAKAAQVNIDLSGGTGSLVSSLVSISDLDLSISLANATAVNDATVSCSTQSMTLKLTNQTLANIRLTAKVTALFGLLSVASLDTGAAPTVNDGSYKLSVPQNYTTPVVTNSGTLGINLSNASAKVLGIIDLGSLTSLLQPVIDAVSSLVTGPLSKVLGLTVAGADLYAVRPTPTCGAPELVD